MHKSIQNKDQRKAKHYILYARKSTTSEDRQVASIESQIEVMTEVANEYGLEISEIMSESRSGFKTGRPVFNEMVKKIENGEADGVVVWKLSRLSRNPEDAGKIMGMIQEGVIQHIRTVDRNWYPEDNVMMMYVEFGVNNQYSKDLSVDTRRGLSKKADRGWLPIAILPLGYQHVQVKKLGETEIKIETDRFPIIQQGLKAVASRAKTPIEAYEFVKTLGLKGRRGEEIAKSVWYKMLSNPFYAGTFEFPQDSGNFYEGKHQLAISEDEFDAIQDVLGGKNKAKQIKHFFAYTGMMRCGECGCAITAENKTKKQKNGNVHRYVYYRCTKKKGHCSQPCTNIDKLEPQFEEILSNIKVPKAFHEWAIDQIKQDQQKYIDDRDLTQERSRKTYDLWVKKIDRLVEKYVDGKISEDVYERKLAEYELGKKRAMKVLNSVDGRIEERIKEIDEDLDFAVKARMEFENGGKEKRKEIVMRLGSNLILNNHTLEIELREPLERVSKIAIEVNCAAERFEPLENVDNSAEFKLYLSNSPVMGG